jgi:hypothetical protein
MKTSIAELHVHDAFTSVAVCGDNRYLGSYKVLYDFYLVCVVMYEDC